MNATGPRGIVVLGDLMLDRYWRGDTGRISPEAPVPIVRVMATEERLGGAGNVAANVAALGAEVTLIGLVGTDAEAACLEGLCRARGLDPRFVPEPLMPTIVKLRVLAQHQQLLRLDFESPITPSTGAREALALALREAVRKSAVAVFSDYAKGALSDVQTLIAAARGAQVFTIVDPKGRDFARYAGADLVTPNLAEFEAVVGRCEDEETLVTAARSLCARHGFGALLVTRGERGMTLVPATGAVLSLGTRARDVFDVTGAGDTVCATLAWALARGEALTRAVELANRAAGIAVGKLGTAVVTAEELEESQTARHAGPPAVMDEAALLAAVRDARARGLRVVMTNGCFDVLHVGHVRYLEEAAALGDRLIVAVNSDASVARLKGAGRPVNCLEDRMEVLQRLGAVDWVVAFDEDTPRTLVGRVLPDLLVKGGDYQIAEIAGAAEVIAAGGRVLTLPFHEGHSSTRLIRQGVPRGEGAP